MPWVVVALAIGLVAVAVGVIAMVVVGRRTPGSTPEMTGDQFLTLGIVFIGAGVALMVAIGPGMIGIMVLGIIYMGMGARMKRQEGNDQHRSQP